jgi:DMSO/TMAO reductase YedYZ molybdopterin-dependent catalytic subunit
VEKRLEKRLEKKHPLTPEHGAPLRLVAPVKYGIKYIKRIGRITFTDERPGDFRAERGYDWHSGHLTARRGNDNAVQGTRGERAGSS